MSAVGSAGEAAGAKRIELGLLASYDFFVASPEGGHRYRAAAELREWLHRMNPDSEPGSEPEARTASTTQTR